MIEFAGKVAVITGAAEGIGKAIAEATAARGMKLLLADMLPYRKPSTAERYRSRGGDEGLSI